MSVDATADFYFERADGLRWLGSVSIDGDPAQVGEHGLFDGVYGHNANDFRYVIGRLLDWYVDNDRGYSAAHGDTWPWPWAHSGADGGTDWAYIYHAGHLRVYRRVAFAGGLFHVATHILNHPRNPHPFPTLGGPDA